MFTIMTEAAAKEIAEWNYPDIYAIYSFDGSNEVVQELLNGQYYVAFATDHQIIGYICVDESARIRTVETDVYMDETMMDIGLGIHPALCGKGGGAKFLASAITFLNEQFNCSSYRLTVADFNRRAIKVYERVGFQCSRVIHQTSTNKHFQIMIYRR